MLVERGEAVVGGQRGWLRGQPKGGNMDDSKYLLQQQMHIVGLLICFSKAFSSFECLLQSYNLKSFNSKCTTQKAKQPT